MAIRPNVLSEARAEVALSTSGKLTARLDMTDIGTGSYTILTQIAADTLSIPASLVSVELGDSAFPETAGSGGSFGAASSGSAFLDACRNLKTLLGEHLAQAGLSANEFKIEGNRIVAGSSEIALADILDSDGLHAEGAVDPDDYGHGKAQYSYGTQLMGGMIFGIGGALLEESLMDERYGSFMNRDLAEYHIAVNRDVPDLEVHMLDGFSKDANPLGSKGIGELGICGAGPAIANAIYEATGFRARKFPIHLEDVLDHLPAL